MPTSPGGDTDYAKLDKFLAGLSRDEISYLCDAATAILESDDSAEPTPESGDDGQPSEQQEQSDFAGDDMMERNYLEE